MLYSSFYRFYFKCPFSENKINLLFFVLLLVRNSLNPKFTSFVLCFFSQKDCRFLENRFGEVFLFL